MPGCLAWQALDAYVPAVQPGGGLDWTLGIPVVSGLLGAPFYNQVVVFDAAAGNPQGAVISNGGAGILGQR